MILMLELSHEVGDTFGPVSHSAISLDAGYQVLHKLKNCEIIMMLISNQFLNTVFGDWNQPYN